MSENKVVDSRDALKDLIFLNKYHICYYHTQESHWDVSGYLYS